MAVAAAQSRSLGSTAACQALVRPAGYVSHVPLTLPLCPPCLTSLQTMTASAELKAALTPEVAQQLTDLAANGAAIDQNPNTPNTLAALANPIDAVALINSMAQLSAAAPAVEAAQGPAPAAAPAPASSGALSASPVLAAVASVLLVAALL